MSVSSNVSVRLPLLVMAALGLSACGGTYLEGMELADLPPTAAVATYTVSECTDIASGRRGLTPTLTYYLESNGISFFLYEFDPQGRGAKMTNHWVQGGTDMFFSYASVINSGFRFMIPKDRSLPGKRLVYRGGQFEAKLVDGAMQIIGNPITDCPMVPGPDNAPVPPPPPPPVPVITPEPIAPVAAAPPAAGSCVRDKDCAAGELCEAGACIPGKPAEPEDTSDWECRSDKDCPGDDICQAHKCTPAMPCKSDKDCPGEDLCNGGLCIPTTPVGAPAETAPLCSEDKECKGNRVCEDGQCKYKKKGPKGLGDPCKVDVDCPGHLVCEDLQCKRSHG